LIGLLAALVAGPARALGGLYFSLATIWIIGFGFWGLPLLDGANSARTIMRQAGERIDPQAEIGLVGWREQNLLQADRPVTEFGFSRAPADQLRRGIAWLAVKPDQRWLDRITLSAAKAYLAEGKHFAKGSMAPKIQAIIRYLEAGGKHAIITNPENISRALRGETGTHIVAD